MDLERALEMQRVKLLRLLTGWFALMALVSGGSLAFPLPRWARSFFVDLIVRAEFGAQCLVRVSAHLQAGERWALAENSVSSFPVLEAGDAGEDVPSTAALIRRMKALRRLLRDVPRYARRLLRPLVADDRAGHGAVACGSMRKELASPQWIAPQDERPPDKECTFVSRPNLWSPSDLFRGSSWHVDSELDYRDEPDNDDSIHRQSVTQ